ncbi:MAG: hypothetical protein J0G99_12990 [Alphaproteobacteria bacterium]|nr:hypothetical protein [Alphaproteobacteria bacterium]
MKTFCAASAAMLAVALTGCAATSQAPAPGVLASEDFESTAPGAIPAGFTKTGDVEVEQGVAHSGTHALRIDPAVRGGRFISLDPAKVAALGGEHWGRLYYKMKTPTPMPTGRLIHATFVDGKATSPLANDLIDVRLATLLFYPTGQFNYFYNVQPPKGRKEFGPKSAIAQKFTDDWTLLEWHADYATQTYQFYVNGKEVADIGQHKGAGNYEGIEIPAAFQTLSVGFTNYQPATGDGFTVWIDDFAVGKERLGPVRGARK